MMTFNFSINEAQDLGADVSFNGAFIGTLTEYAGQPGLRDVVDVVQQEASTGV